MIAFILAELAGWNNYCGSRSIKFVIYCCALTGITCLLRPDICFPVLITVFAWLGMGAFRPEEGESEEKTWIREARLTPWKLIAAKILSSFLVTLLHLIIILPVFILATSIWGIPWSTIGFIGLILILTAITAAIFELLLKQSVWIEPFQRILVVFIWFAIVTFIPNFRVLSPFTWAFRITLRGAGRDTLTSLGLNLLFMFILTIVTRIFIKKENWNSDEN